jgi:hypothetical protein
MTLPNELGLVRIIWIEGDVRPYTGTPGVARPPRVGDIGTIVHAFSETIFAIESVDSDGRTVWLADFYLARRNRGRARARFSISRR